MSEQFPADKGKLGGSCNRSACLAPGAQWYNRYTDAHYCSYCAGLLNRVFRGDKMDELKYVALPLDNKGEL